MPRFSGQNKKRINPRYFLNETTDITRMDTLQDSGEVDEGILSQMMGADNVGVEEGDELVVNGYNVEVTDVIRPGQTIEVAFLDTKDGLESATAVWNGSEWELASGSLT